MKGKTGHEEGYAILRSLAVGWDEGSPNPST